MAGPESPQQAPQQPKDIPGFKGLEQLNKIESLKKGAFREFIDKVVAIRSNPEAQKKVTDALQKIDNNPTLSDEQKKEQLRSQPSTELLAIIGKNIEFGEKGMSVTLDFGKLAFAEKTAIGAGHLFPPNTQNISFGDAQGGTVAKRTAGTRGGEYRSEKDKYMSSFTGTKIFIAYKDILPLDAKQMESAIQTEKDSTTKVRTVVDTASAAQTDLRGSEKLAPPEKTPTVTQEFVTGKESKEVQVSRSPVFIGDSQVEGLRGALSRKGVFAADFRGLKMETIAGIIKDPSKIDQYYPKEKQQKYKKGVMERTAQLRDRIKGADSIFLQCGGNNIVAGNSVEAMQRNLQALIGAIKEVNPSVRINVGLLLPPSSKPINIDTRIRYNQWLIEEGKKGTFHVVDSYSAVADKNGSARFDEQYVQSPENPHMNGRGYAHLAKTALEAINYQAA